MDIRDYADDGQQGPRRLVPYQAEMLAERVFSRPKLRREGLIHDYPWRSLDLIGFDKDTAAPRPHLHHAKIVAADHETTHAWEPSDIGGGTPPSSTAELHLPMAGQFGCKGPL